MMNTPIKKDEREKSELPPDMAENDLKSFREAKGFTLKDIFEHTRISVTHLEAIEQGNFHSLPAPVFTKAFIKAYAKMLGIDSLKILARYNEYLETLRAPAQEVEEVRDVSQSTTKKYKFLFGGVLVLVAIGIIVFYISSYKSNVDISKSQTSQLVQSAPEPPPPESTGVNTQIKSESAGQMNPMVAAVSPSAPSNTTQTVQGTTDRTKADKSALAEKTASEINQLRMEAKEPTWIRIKTGQDAPEEILMQPGEKIDRSSSRFMIDIGNAAGVSILFQGKRMENLGGHGQVIHLKLP